MGSMIYKVEFDIQWFAIVIFFNSNVFDSSSIWTCRIWNLEYLQLFSNAGAFEKLKTNVQNSKFKISNSTHQKSMSYQGQKYDVCTLGINCQLSW